MRRAVPFLVAALLVAVLAGCGGSGPDRGIVHFVKRTDPSFDAYTAQATPGFRRWMRAHFWRMETFSPYFDAKTRWYRNGWFYRDLYAIKRGTALAANHPDWILRDAAGRPLYIPYGCGGGSCPQYAGDPANAAFRRFWIDGARAHLRHGRYRGIWVDDVNIDPRVGDGAGRIVMPVDRRTGRAMTTRAWGDAIAAFAEQIRRELPRVEIVHNALWFAGGAARDADPAVGREIAAADFLNIERGVNDDGLAPGDGPFSLTALLAHVDHLHAQGKGVIFDAFDPSPAGREYNLAAYFVVSEGHDGVGLADRTPANWWRLYDADLGDADGGRSLDHGILRRKFAHGLVLLDGPGGPTRTVRLPGPMLDSSGRTVRAVRLAARRGAVLRSLPAG